MHQLLNKYKPIVVLMLFVCMTVGSTMQNMPAMVNASLSNEERISKTASVFSNFKPKENWSDGTLKVKERTPFNDQEWTGKVIDTVSQVQVYEVNREKAHAELQPYQTQEAAVLASREYDKTKSSFYKPLTTADDLDPVKSSWKFNFVSTLTKTPATANETKDPFNSSQNIVDFYKTDYNAANWNSIAVPSSWQVQGVGEDGLPYTGYYDPTYGYDPPFYTNIANPGSIRIKGQTKKIFNDVPQFQSPNDYNPVGFYRKEFDVDKKWIDNNFKVFISFQGVEAAYYVYVNGKEVGYHEDSKTPGEFDITDLLNTDGKDNLLAVKVFRWSDASWIEDQDFIRLGGIFRDVYLMAAPPAHIRDYKVETTFDDDFTDATLSLETIVHNYTSGKTYNNLGVAVQVIDNKGTDITDGQSLNYNVGTVTPGNEVNAGGSIVVKNPRKWFTDDPYLYTLVIALYDKDTNEVYEYISQELGFRQITFRLADNYTPDAIRLNGQKVMLRGVNRHDTTPYGGRYVSPETYETDLQIMKKNNINTVRTAHYPSDTYLHWLADKYGIMVIAEANNECHSISSAGNSNNENATPNVISKENFFYAANDRVMNIVEKEKNRTSVVMWSLGNETGAYREWEDIVENIRPIDYTRPVQYEGRRDQVNKSNYISTRSAERRLDILSSMYWDVASGKNNGSGTWGNNNVRLPFYQCEYAHAMGNSVGNLKEYWDAFRSAPFSQGGCIWEFVSHSIWTKPSTSDMWDTYGNQMYLGYGGDWGEGNNDGNFCADGMLTATREVKPEMQEVKKVYQEVNFEANEEDLEYGVVRVRNESIGVDASVYDYKWTLTEDDRIIGSGTLDNVPSIPAAFKQDIVKDIPTVDLAVPFADSLPDMLTPGAEYFLTIQACLKEDRPWAGVGHVIGEEQFKLPVKSDNGLPTVKYKDKDTKEITVDESDSSLILTGKNFTISYNKENGLITNYTANGVHLLEEGPRPSFWRAKTDNDKLSNNVWTNIDNNLPKPTFKTTPMQDEHSVKVEVTYELTSVDVNSFIDMTYMVYFNGAVKIDADLRTTNRSSIYRFGFDMKMPAGFENVDWLARGPKENLIDRMTGAFVGHYSSTVSENFFGYGRPQDTGTRQETRWMTLTGEGENTGLMVAATGGRYFESNALHFTWRMLDRRHIYMLRPLQETVISVNYGSRGTGGASCGPETLQQYRMNSSDMSYSYTLVPIDVGTPVYGISEIARGYEDEPTFQEGVTVTYEAGTGGSIQGKAIQTIGKGESTNTVIAIPESGYSFVQWDDGETKTARSDVNVQENKTIKAEFKKIINMYKITLDPNGGLVSNDAIEVKEGELIGTLPIPTRNGYTFIGWFTSKTGGEKITPNTIVTKAMTIYAQWDLAVTPPIETRFNSGNLKYKVTKKAFPNGSGIVQVVGSVNKKATKFAIPSTVKNQTMSYKVESIAKNAFKNHKKLKTVVLGNHVKEIQNGAFRGCSVLTNVTIGKSVVKIGSQVFYNDKKLKSIGIKSKKLKSIGKNTLKNIHRKAVIKVPSVKFKAYKKLLREKGQKKTVVIKKGN